MWSCSAKPWPNASASMRPNFSKRSSDAGSVTSSSRILRASTAGGITGITSGGRVARSVDFSDLRDAHQDHRAEQDHARRESVRPNVTERGEDDRDDAENQVRIHFLGFGIFAPDSRALAYAIATACFCGFPARTSVAMFRLIVFCDVPFFNGISVFPFVVCSKPFPDRFDFDRRFQPESPTRARIEVDL